VHAILSRSDLAVPLLERKGGTVKAGSFTAGSTAQRARAARIGGRRQSRWLRTADGFAVCAGRSRQVLLQPAEKNLSKRARQRALPRQIRQISIRWSGWISPLLVRDFSFRHPNDAVQQHDPIGGQGKAVGSVADGFAVLSCYREFPNCKVFALWFHAI